MMKNLFGFILAGGSGERFWPQSRKNVPKQVLPIFTKNPMIYETIKRVAPLIASDKLFVITNKKIKGAIQKRGIKANMLLEPQPKNTAAAIGLGCIHALHRASDAVVVIMPSDHYIEDVSKFLKTIEGAAIFAKSRKALISIGIKPTYPAVSYGYIEMSGGFGKIKGKRIYKISRFIEKPKKDVAERLLRYKKCLWNGGIFVFKARDVLDEMNIYMPKLHEGLLRVAKYIGKKRYSTILAREFGRFENISIDYGLMEYTENGYVIQGDFGWDDVGLWSNITKFHPKDENGNVAIGRHCGHNSHDNIIFSTQEHLVATCGIKGLIIIHTDDATLVCHKNNAEDVKAIVSHIKKDASLHKYL